jgi:hypothetical protein
MQARKAPPQKDASQLSRLRMQQTRGVGLFLHSPAQLDPIVPPGPVSRAPAGSMNVNAETAMAKTVKRRAFIGCNLHLV